MQRSISSLKSFVNLCNKRKSNSIPLSNNIFKSNMSSLINKTPISTTILKPPIATKKPHIVHFGINPNDLDEDRGENPMNPPIEINDNYYWLRDDERKNPEILKYLNDENEYFQNYMSSTEKFQQELYNKMLNNFKRTNRNFGKI